MGEHKHILVSLTPEAFRRILSWYSAFHSEATRDDPVDSRLAAMLASYAVRNGVGPADWWQGLFHEHPEYTP